jgi:hypothetical protein
MRRKYNKTFVQKLHKEFCEIEGCNVKDSNLLHHHHIIERTETNTTNDPYNMAVVCANHHNMIHSGRLEIIGVYPAANRHGRILVYKLDGIPNIPGIDEPYYKPEPKQMKIPFMNEEEEK